MWGFAPHSPRRGMRALDPTYLHWRTRIAYRYPPLANAVRNADA